MPTRNRTGFTLVEMMIVLVVIIALLLILVPTFNLAQRTAYMASCASNLQQIYYAHQLKSQEEFRARRLENIEGWTWPKTIVPYLGNAEALICPEDGDPSGGATFNGLKLALQETRNSPFIPSKADFNKALDYVDLSLDVHWVRQLSREQFDSVEAWIKAPYSGYPHPKAPYRDVGGRMRQFWAPERYSGYVPGANPNLFYLLVEPDAVTTANMSWVNFADFVIEVERLPGGDLRVSPMHGVMQSKTAGWLIDAAGNDALSPSGVLQPNDSRSLILPGNRCSYGMNGQALWKTMATGKNRIVAMDYGDVIVEATTWHDWDNADGRPSYGRHPSGNRVNALFLDGAVNQVDPWEITPELLTLENMYWNF